MDVKFIPQLKEITRMGNGSGTILARDALVEGAIRKNQKDFENRQITILNGR